jgi:two-component system, NarL family, response regulator LiaR
MFTMLLETTKTVQLTPRELTVLNHLKIGFMYKEISHELGIGMDTVKKHCKNIYLKLEVRNRTEAAVKSNC